MPSFWDKVREDFPNTKQSTYLDHAAGGPIPLPVFRRIQEHLEENAHEADFAWPKWMKRLDKAREKTASFLNADPEEITFINSTSQGMNFIAEALAGEGAVLTNSSEFPSSTLPWIWRGARMIFQEPECSELSLGKLQSLLSPQVKTVLTSYIQYATGFRQDMEALGRLKGERFFVVNATQGFGSFPVDVKAWKADFLCSNSYKWLMAGYGGGVLYIRKKWLRRFRPASLGWRSVKEPDKMRNRYTRLLPQAARYELGCPSFPSIFAVGAAVDYLSSIGIGNISERILELTAYAADRLQHEDFEIASSLHPGSRSGILIVRMSHSERVWKRLLAHKIFVTARGEGLRLAPHFYNSFEEIDFFVDKLVEARDKESRRKKTRRAL